MQNIPNALRIAHIRYENNSKLIKDQNVRAESTQFLEENIDINLCYLPLGNSFLNMAQKHKQQRKNKLDFKM